MSLFYYNIFQLIFMYRYLYIIHELFLLHTEAVILMPENGITHKARESDGEQLSGELRESQLMHCGCKELQNQWPMSLEE